MKKRKAWQQVAVDLGVRFIDIEVICSDNNEHQRRVETRHSSIPNLKLPTWKQVQEREYESWDRGIIRIDTAEKEIQQSIVDLFAALRE